MERPTKEVMLAISGVTAVVYSYYTRGEKKTIEAIMLESAEFEQVGDRPKLKKVDVTYRAKMEDKAVLLAVKNLVKDGKETKLTQQILDDMPDDDFAVLQKALPSSQGKKK